MSHDRFDLPPDHDDAEDRHGRPRARRVRVAVGNGLAVATVAGIGIAFGLHQAHSTGSNSVGFAGTGGAPSASQQSSSGAAAVPDAAIPAATPSSSPSSAAPLAAPPKSSAPASPAAAAGMSREQILDTLRSLLPAGSQLSHVNTYTQAGSLEVDYNDGRGAVDLILTIAPSSTMPDALNCPSPLWKDEGTRPAGALPISCAMRTPPGGGLERDAVMYADSFGFYGFDIYDQRPDGVTVFIQVADGINHTLPQVDRATPPGTMQQWEAVVESPGWHL